MESLHGAQSLQVLPAPTQGRESKYQQAKWPPANLERDQLQFVKDREGREACVQRCHYTKPLKISQLKHKLRSLRWPYNSFLGSKAVAIMPVPKKNMTNCGTDFQCLDRQCLVAC